MTVAAILAVQEARREKERCVLYVEGFEHNAASVEEVQAYAGCVERLYPKPVSEEGVVVGKVCVSLLFLAALLGAVYGYKENGVEGGVFHGLMWPIGCAAAIFTFFLVFAGIGFVLS